VSQGGEFTQVPSKHTHTHTCRLAWARSTKVPELPVSSAPARWLRGVTNAARGNDGVAGDGACTPTARSLSSLHAAHR
jgi:hypothetical protein